MSKSARLQIRISPDSKARSEKLFESMGLSMSTAVNLFIERCLTEGQLPFHIDVNPSQKDKRSKLSAKRCKFKS